MICNICSKAGDYYTDYKKSNDEYYLTNAKQLHWLCANKPSQSDNCFCQHKTEPLVQK